MIPELEIPSHRGGSALRREIACKEIHQEIARMLIANPDIDIHLL
jgi:hypothetical protein